MRRRRPFRRPSGLHPALLAGCAFLLLAPLAQAEVVMAPGHVAAPVSSSSTSGVKVGGKLTSPVAIDGLESSASGKGAVSVMEANRITSTTVGGDLEATTEVGRLTQRAEGQNAQAITVIGTIDDVTTGGDLVNTVILGTSLNVAIGAGAVACTELGTIGGDPVCR